MARTGIPRPDRPAEFGRWEAMHAPFRRWAASGGLCRLFELLTANPGLCDDLWVLVDSTLVRTQYHATGAGEIKRAWPSGRRRPRPPAGVVVGLSSKVIVTAADEDTVIAVEVVPGQASDTPSLVPVLDRTVDRVPMLDEIVGDKGFDGDQLRFRCLDRVVNLNIPLKAKRDPDK